MTVGSRTVPGARPVHRDPRDGCAEPRLEPVAQGAQPGGLGVQAPGCEASRHAEADDAPRRSRSPRAGPFPARLRTTCGTRRTPFRTKRAPAPFGPAELVCRERQEVDSERADVDRDLPDGLNRVRVDESSRAPGRRRECREPGRSRRRSRCSRGWPRRGPSRDRSASSNSPGRGRPAESTGSSTRLEAERDERAGRLPDGRMLGRRDEDPPTFGVRLSGRERAAPDRKVVRLRPARREDDLRRGRPDGPRHLGPRLFDRIPGGAPGRVDGRSVCREGQPRRHRLQRPRAQPASWRGGRRRATPGDSGRCGLHAEF